jgi:protein-disulfide isomerase
VNQRIPWLVAADRNAVQLPRGHKERKMIDAYDVVPPVTDSDHGIGPVDAATTLIAYGDYECSCCRQAHMIVKQILAALDGKVRFVFRNFPSAENHAHATRAAEAAESVYAQGGAAAFWSMHDAIFEQQQNSPDALDDIHLSMYAADVGVDPDVVLRDLDSGRFTARVQADLTGGVIGGVKEAPTLFINGAWFDGDWNDPLDLLTQIDFQQVVS